MTVKKLLLIVALLCFAAATFGVSFSVNLVAAGLALYTTAHLL